VACVCVNTIKCLHRSIVKVATGTVWPYASRHISPTCALDSAPVQDQDQAEENAASSVRGEEVGSKMAKCKIKSLIHGKLKLQLYFMKYEVFMKLKLA
jgi:hypothetical protein